MAMPVHGIILAAGKGTRMKSELPKGLFAVAGLPMAQLIGRAMRDAGVERPIVVIGYGGELLKDALGDDYEYVWQHEQLGTGHAALMAEPLLADKQGPVLITPGDTPLIDGEMLRQVVETHLTARAECTLATVRLPDPSGYGRIVRDPHNRVRRIVEDRDATPRERQIQEICTSVYCINAPTLLGFLPRLGNRNAQGEYYLTDIVEAIYDAGGLVETRHFDDLDMLRGVNDRWQLAQAGRLVRERILKRIALGGVTIVDPSSTYIEFDVEVGADTVIEPFTAILRGSRIGAGCRIGPNTRIQSSIVSDGVRVSMSCLEDAVVEVGATVGPYARLRPGTVVGPGARVGNFVELKNTKLAADARVPHLSYVGDATVGEHTNIGAGTITCNYDGFVKHPTVVGTNAFVGSNSTLVAPVTIGDGAMIAAGSVITADVPPNALGVGRARQEVKEEWVAKWRKRKSSTE